MTPDLTVSRTIAAPAEAIFAAISDVTGTGKWSPENHANEWIEGATGPAVGARFAGHNRNGDKEWTTEAEIVEYVPNERFFFDCDFKKFVFAKWGYTIEETDGGCLVTEYWQDLRPEEARVGISPVSGVGDRAAYNKTSMDETLANIAASVEGNA